MAQYVVIGAGVIGLTTALEMKTREPNSIVTIVAKHHPGDRSIDYTSPWAGGNWLSMSTDNGRQEQWDEISFRRFEQLADNDKSSGIERKDVRAIFDNSIEDAGVLSEGTGKIWYDKLVGGLRWLEKKNLPSGAQFGFDCATFVIDVHKYLPWLQVQVLRAGVDLQRKSYTDIREVFREFPQSKAFFNCTGLGSFHLKGVQDEQLYPTRGQVMLVESPAKPLERMYFRSPKRVASDTTYVFPRGKNGGVILGGCRMDGVWEGEVDPAFAEDIKRRCCALCPELGKPEDLKVISHGVGLRPSRKGGPRIEKELIDQRVVIHNYGAAGAGYQASWGMAKASVDLLCIPSSKL